MPRLLLFQILLAATLPIFAQKTVLPIKKEGKWGYINTKGKIVVPPKYDALADWNLPWHGLRATGESQHRLVSLGTKCGLLDRAKREILPPVFDRIFALADTLFAVRRDSFFGVVNHRGAVVFDASDCDDICLTEAGNGALTDVFFLKKNFRWGAAHRSGRWRIEPQYFDIQMFKSCRTRLVVQPKAGAAGRGVVNLKNQQVLPPDFPMVKIFAENCYLVGDRDHQFAVDERRIPLFAGEWDNFIPLNDHLLVLEDKGAKNVSRFALYHFRQRKIIREATTGNRFAPLDERFAIVRENGGAVLMDSTGEIFSLPKVKFKNIRPTGSQFYRVSTYEFSRGGDICGLYLPGLDSLSLPAVYSSIGNFRDSVAVVHIGKRCGLVNLAMQEVVPPMYDTIFLEENFAKAQTDSSLVVFELRGDGTVVRADEFLGAMTIEVAEADSLVVPKSEMQKKYQSRDEDEKPSAWGNSEFASDGRWQWKTDSSSRSTAKIYSLIFRDSATGRREQVIAPTVRFLWHFEKLGLAFVFSDTARCPNPFERLAGGERSKLARAALFDYEKRQFLTDFEFIGLRRRDFDRGLPQAVAIDRNGKFCLVGRDGKLARLPDGSPLRATFIDEFEENRARFCTAGTLRPASDDERRSSWEAPPLDDQFGITTLPQQISMPALTLAVEPAKNTDSTRWGFVDTLGRVVIEPIFDFARPFSRGMAACQKSKFWGVVDTDGDSVLGFRYRWLTNLGDYWRVFVRQPTEFFFTSGGARDTAQRSPSILKKVEIGKTQAAANRTSTAPPRPSFLKNGDNFLFANEGFTGIDTLGRRNPNAPKREVKRRYLFLNSQGEPEFGRAFFEIKKFENGLALAKVGYLWGALNQFGIFVVPPKYGYIERLSGGGLSVKIPNLMGLVDRQGRQVLPADFDRIELVAGGFFRVEKGDLVGYARLDGSWIWSPCR